MLSISGRELSFTNKTHHHREDWNEDWAIVDGAGYFDMQELEEGGLVFVESNKLTVRYHTVSPTTLQWLKVQLR